MTGGSLPCGLPSRDGVNACLLRPSPSDSAPIRQRLQSRFGTDSRAAFHPLAAIGRGGVGAGHPLPESEAPSGAEKIAATPAADTEVEQAIIRPRHGSAVAKQAGLGNADALIHEILTLVPSALSTVGNLLPKTFPTSVSDKIFSGIAQQAKVLAAG